MAHPYRSLPPRQFWAKAVSDNYDPSAVGSHVVPLIRADDKIVTAGSCFAANLIPYLESAGLSYLKTEYTHSLYEKIPPENLSYGKFSAGYGNIYTARQLLQLLRRALGEFKPIEDHWVVDGTYIDCFRPALAYAARSAREFEALTAAHLQAVKRAFAQCDTFIFTLGLTEAWVSSRDGAVFPACPGTIAGEFDPERHTFVNFTVNEVIDDLREFVRLLRSALNPGVRIILTVSPVPLVATAEDRHVLSATVYSKSVLRVAAETITRESDNVYYFPAYDIITGPQAPENFFEADRRNVSKAGVDAVMQAFLAACEVDEQRDKPGAPDATQSTAGRLSGALSDLECEEAAQALDGFTPTRRRGIFSAWFGRAGRG